MAEMKKDSKGRPVKFIRVRGRIVPIRSDQGVDLRSNRPAAYSGGKKGSNQVMKDVQDIYKKHGREMNTKERVKSGVGVGIVGAAFGGAVGAALGGAVKAVTKTKGNIGKLSASLAAISGLAAGYAAYNSKSKVLSNKKFNKEFGKKIAGRLKKTSV